MGLLDFLGSQGGGAGGGLLDFLRNNALNQQMTQGPQSDVAQYGQPVFPPAMPQQNAQPSPLDTAQWPNGPNGPNGAQSQASAQIAPQQPAIPAQPAQIPQPPQQQGNTGGFGAGLNGFISNLHTGPIGALIGGIGSAAGLQDPKAQATRRQADFNAAALRAHGASEADILSAVGDGRTAGNTELWKALIANKVKEQDQFRPATADERKAAGLNAGAPMFINTSTNEPKFGPPQTNVNVSTEKTGQAELVKQAVESHVGAQNAARESQKRIGLYDAFERAAQGFTPGATAEMRLTAKRYLKDAGLISGTDVPDGEIQQMIGRTLAIHAQPKGQGAVSNYERQLYASSLPSMSQSPEGLKQAIGINRKLEQFDQQVAQIYRESAGAHNGLPNYLDVQEKIAKLGSPLSDKDMAAMSSPSSASAPSAASDGATATNPKTGAKVIFKGGKWVPFT